MNCNVKRLILECLEDRTVPARPLQLDASGNLTGIFGNTSEDVSLSYTAANTVNVDEGLNDLGTYNVAGNLTVTLGNTVAADVDVLVDLNGFTHDGSLFITVGNATSGYDVDIQDGTIAGELRVRTGNGPDFFFLGDLAPVTVQGSAFLDMSGGSDDALISGSSIEGSLQVVNVDVAFDLVNSAIGGLFTFDARRASLPVNLTMDAGSSIAGLATISSGAGNDVFTLDGEILGALTVQMNNGVNTLSLSATALVLGATTVVGGNGVDTVNVTGSFLAANLTVNLANGNDVVGLTGAASILGNAITILGGNGADAVTVGSGLTAPGARFSFLAGNGNDTFNFDATTSVLASLFYDGGFGVDTFNVLGIIAFPSVIRNVP